MGRKNKLGFSLFAALAVLIFTPFGKLDVNAADIPQEVIDKVDKQGLKGVYDTLFDPDLTKQDVKVVSPEEAKNHPVAMTRLDNGKVAYTVNGEPFYPLGVETGWWDTRVDDNGKMSSPPSDVGEDFKKVSDDEWNAYFSDMRNMGFDTVQLMIYWKDWEPEQGKYDFTFLDHVTDLAANNGLKTEFIIFFHSQTDNIPRIQDKFWGYNLDNVDVGGVKYALSMQWGDGLTSAEDIRKYRDDHPNSSGVENFLEYWHPKVFDGITNALTALGAHYRDSSNIVGYQIGNEEGFNYYVDSGNDKNPYYNALYEDWKADPQNAGKDINKFRAETVDNLWKCFNNALHKGDPYKPTTTNTQSGNMEKENRQDNVHSPDGTTMSFYRSVDMIGSMFYGDASVIYPHLDENYQNADKTAYADGFPILFPTEISATMNDGNVAKMIAGETIARGGQGLGFYCYGELYNDFEQKKWSDPKPVLGTIKTMLSTLNDTKDLIRSGLPVTSTTTGNMFMALKDVQGIGDPTQGNPEVSVLQADDGRILGVLDFPGNANNSGTTAAAERTVDLDFTAKEPDTYKIELHKTDGTIDIQTIQVDSADTAVPIQVETTGCDVTYIVAGKTTETPPTDKQIVGIETLNLPDKVAYSVGNDFSTQGLKIRVRYNDGSAKVLTANDQVQISEPDMGTVGQKEVTVTYSGFKTTFHITVQEAPYQTNLTDAADTQDSLDHIFDNNMSTQGGFVANDADLEKMRNQESYFQYNFPEKVSLKGVELATNYAQDQAILSFKLAVPGPDGNWVFLGDNGGQQYDLDWQTNDSSVETQEVSVAPPVETDKVRMYVLNAANRWTDNFGHGNHKFEMSEIQFKTDPVPVVTAAALRRRIR